MEKVLRSAPDDDFPFADASEYMDIKSIEHIRKWDKYDRDQGKAA